VDLTRLWFALAFVLVCVPVLLLRGRASAEGVAVVLLVGTLVIAAWWWALRGLRRQRAAGQRLEELRRLPPAAFEAWVGARFRDLGYSVRHTGAQGDHGVDLEVSRPGETAVVQCKKYGEWAVGEPTVRDLFGALHAAGADRAYLVTTGRVTEPARKWVTGKPIELWDGDELMRRFPPTTAAAAEALRHLEPSAPAAAACPRCGAALVARRNSRTGDPFLGCARFPRCRHTESARDG
jgi:restriction system protein